MSYVEVKLNLQATFVFYKYSQNWENYFRQFLTDIPTSTETQREVAAILQSGLAEDGLMDTEQSKRCIQRSPQQQRHNWKQSG